MAAESACQPDAEALHEASARVLVTRLMTITGTGRTRYIWCLVLAVAQVPGIVLNFSAYNEMLLSWFIIIHVLLLPVVMGFWISLSAAWLFGELTAEPLRSDLALSPVSAKDLLDPLLSKLILGFTRPLIAAWITFFILLVCAIFRPGSEIAGDWALLLVIPCVLIIAVVASWVLGVIMVMAKRAFTRQLTVQSLIVQTIVFDLLFLLLIAALFAFFGIAGPGMLIFFPLLLLVAAIAFWFPKWPDVRDQWLVGEE